jgi:hypothetical protein
MIIPTRSTDSACVGRSGLYQERLTMSILRAVVAVTAVLIASAACSDNTTDFAAVAVQLQSVAPAGGATGVATSTPIVLRFSGPMMSGAEQFVLLHQGAGVTGMLQPMACEWSADQTTLTCQPQGPLGPHMDYTLHLGGGMRDDAGHSVGMTTATAWEARWSGAG